MPEFYENPTRRIIQNGALASLRECIENYLPKRLLLVLGRSSFQTSQYYTSLKNQLASWSIEESAPVLENPTVSFIKNFCDLYRNKEFGCVVAIGGGSVLDVAKLASVLLLQPPDALDRTLREGQAFPDRKIPLIAIPTTSGTGSEVTPYASITTDEGRKVSVTRDSLYPTIALIDPLLTHSMPAYMTVSTGFDVLCQGIESFWSKRHSPFSDLHALKAVELAVRYLKIAVEKPTDSEARFFMALASCEAGLAIAHTATTAVHAVSYPFTVRFKVPHGHACALTLASFIRFNEPMMREARYRQLWQAMGVASASEAADAVERLMNEVHLENIISKLGVDDKGVETVIREGFRRDRVTNNPRELTPEALREILQKIR